MGYVFLKGQCSYGFMNQQKSSAAHRALASSCTKQSAISHNTSHWYGNGKWKWKNFKYKMLQDVEWSCTRRESVRERITHLADVSLFYAFLMQ